MNRFQLALAGVASTVVALVTTLTPSKAENLGYAQQWIASRFHRAAHPGLRRPIAADRSALSRRTPIRKVAAHRPSYPTYHRPLVRRVVHDSPSYHRPPLVERLVYRVYVTRVVYPP